MPPIGGPVRQAMLTTPKIMPTLVPTRVGSTLREPTAAGKRLWVAFAAIPYMAAQQNRPLTEVTSIQPIRMIPAIPTAGINVFNIPKYLSASKPAPSRPNIPMPFMTTIIINDCSKVKSRTVRPNVPIYFMLVLFN